MIRIRNVIFIVLFTLNGCATLGSAEAFIGCQAADIISTEYALRVNPTAHETNAIPIPILFLIKIALMSWVYINRDEWNNDEDSKGTRALATIISCAPVPGNLQAAKKYR